MVLLLFLFLLLFLSLIFISILSLFLSLVLLLLHYADNIRYFCHFHGWLVASIHSGLFSFSTQDFWIGLYTPTPNVIPYVWERDGSTQPSGVQFWSSDEPNDLSEELCVRMTFDSGLWKTRSCEKRFAVVCEFYTGSQLRL